MILLQANVRSAEHDNTYNERKTFVFFMTPVDGDVDDDDDDDDDDVVVVVVVVVVVEICS
jgi:hypothetical protein